MLHIVTLGLKQNTCVWRSFYMRREEKSEFLTGGRKHDVLSAKAMRDAVGLINAGIRMSVLSSPARSLVITLHQLPFFSFLNLKWMKWSERLSVLCHRFRSLLLAPETHTVPGCQGNVTEAWNALPFHRSVAWFLLYYSFGTHSLNVRQPSGNETEREGKEEAVTISGKVHHVESLLLLVR